MKTLRRALAILRGCFFAWALSSMLWTRITRGDIGAFGLWLIAAAMISSWLLASIDGDLLPQLNLRRKEKPREFAVFQIILAAAIVGFCFLILISFPP